MIEADAVPTEYIPTIWGAVAQELDRALAKADGEMNALDVFAMLMSGQMQLWCAHEGENPLAYAVTSVENYPQQRAARIHILVGERKSDWLPFIKKLEHWAISCGCDYVEWFGRKGWEKEMSKYGYHGRYIVCRKRLTMEDKSKVLH